MGNKQGTPEQRRARAAVNNLVRFGRLVPLPCETCGQMPTEAHHDDYGEPLVIRWLCPTHHKRLHGQRPPSALPTEVREVSRAEAVRLRAHGLDYPTIAHRLGVTKSTVWKWVNRPDYR